MEALVHKIKNIPHRLRELKGRTKNLSFQAELSVVKTKTDGTKVDFGVVGRRVVTDAALAKVVDALVGTYDLSNFNYHAAGNGTTPGESASDTVLESEVETRQSGSQLIDAGKYKTSATITFGAAYDITEHGIFDQATGGVLLDRTFDTAITVAGGESLTFTYLLTVTGS
jgi:hypothetical protein